MTNIPAITVLMPIFNAAQYVAAAVESILAQTFSDFEVILIDDGSTDDTYQILERITDARVRLFRNGQNRGLIYTLNKGIGLAKGKYIARMDADDMSLPHRFATQVKFLEENPEYAIVGSQAYYIFDRKKSTRIFNTVTNPEQFPIYTLFFCPFIHPTVLARASVLKELNYNSDFPVAEDYELWTRILEKYRGINLDEPLIYYRLHDTNSCKTQNLTQLASVRQIYRQHLNRLQIPHTPADLETYLKVSGSYHDTVPMTDCRAVQQWLVRMKKHLIEKGIYPTETIEIVFANVWYSFIQKNKSNGIAAFYLYRTQRGISTKPIATNAQIMLFLKCVGVGNILPLLPQRFYEKIKYWYQK